MFRRLILFLWSAPILPAGIEIRSVQPGESKPSALSKRKIRVLEMSGMALATGKHEVSGMTLATGKHEMSGMALATGKHELSGMALATGKHELSGMALATGKSRATEG